MMLMVHNKYSDTDNMVILVHKCTEVLISESSSSNIKMSVVYGLVSRFGMIHAIDFSCLGFAFTL